MLRRGPLHGYDLHRIVQAHGNLYADLKKANLYYLLDRLAKAGDLTVETEPGARGARGERLIYTLTAQGQAHFDRLLREVVLHYETVHSGIEVAVVFLHLLPISEVIALFVDRRRRVAQHRTAIAAELAGAPNDGSVLGAIAADHILGLIDAELAWLDRSLARLHSEKV